jgi:hypothetical protein
LVLAGVGLRGQHTFNKRFFTQEEPCKRALTFRASSVFDHLLGLKHACIAEKLDVI